MSVEGGVLGVEFMKVPLARLKRACAKPACAGASADKGDAIARSVCRGTIAFVFALLYSSLIIAQTPQLSPESHISLITCSPGKELYSAFGHSALRVHDPVIRIDHTYNYGTFDFDQPNFYSNYAKGRPVFMLSVSQTKYFVRAYVYENRSVYEDVLQLTQPQKQQLFELLEENYLPENREYRYDYIYDNCATRIRDMLEKVVNRPVVFDTFSVPPAFTFRELMDLYLENQPWGDFGIDLALSSVIDTFAPPYYRMFLPDYLQKGFQNAYVVEGDSIVHLVKESAVIYEAEPEKQEQSLFTPLNLFWLLFILFALKTFFDFRRNNISFAADVVLFALVGLAGIVIAYISFFSDHHASQNYNLLWAIPTHLIFSALLPFLKKLKWVKYSLLASAIITSIAFIGGFTFIPQKFNLAFYPIMLTLAMRCLVVCRFSVR